MKFVARLILIALLSYLIPFYAPWWIVLVIGLVIGLLLPGNGWNLFNAGFLGAGLVWLGYALKLDYDTQSIMTNKILELVGIADPLILLLGSGLIGGLSAGLGALTGSSFRMIFIKKKQTSLYS
jgi:Na+-translocating ferredoxin:NAD+ oxidoreductase RnfD subunit